MKNLPMDLLRAFVSVSQLRSFTKAGELLGRSQPAVTLKIKRLEELVDQRLFLRGGKSLELSDSGVALYNYAKQILTLNDLAISQISKSTVYGKIRLGIPSEFATVLLPKIISRFAKAYPNVALEVNCELSKYLLTRAGRESHDLILVLADQDADLDGDLVKTDELVWVSSKKFNRAKEDAVPLIVASKGCIYRHNAMTGLSNASLSWKIVYTNPDLTGIQYAIQEGLGVTVLSRSIVPENLHILSASAGLPSLDRVSINIICNEQRGSDEAIELLKEFLTASLT
ncbi:MAG: LysR family transcriptional regulator [Porticoccaceae bacterium]|nr:LysR family transcriptional regulator [Porticoccaceae bacterium]